MTTLRRGLPRQSGGEPWPPAGPAPSPAVVEETVAVAAVQTVPPSDSSSGTLLSDVPVRRGLPRVVGDEPWPPAGSVPVAYAREAETAAPATASTAVVPKAESRASSGTESRRRIPRGAWNVLAVVVAGGLAILAARWLISLGGVRDFLAAYPGGYALPDGTPAGVPTWLSWQHFLNVFFMVLLVRAGWQIRTETRPSASWTPRWPKGLQKMSITVWLHVALDLVWMINGAVFVVVLFATGYWVRLVPTSWDVFPNALSAALQYASLQWPTENGWVNFNSLQQLAYFATVFVAAPLAMVTGVRMSHVWPRNAPRLNRAYPVELARAVHFPVMLYFCGFVVVHVVLVFSTGALKNLNHMYGGQDADNWVGFWIFLASLAAIAGGWLAARPIIVAPIARLFGKVSR